MLHPINPPPDAQYLDWVVSFQGHLIHALCDPNCYGTQILNEQWVINLCNQAGVGIDPEWVRRFCGWKHEEKPFLQRMIQIADLEMETKVLIQTAFDHDIQIERAYSDDLNQIHNLIGLSNLANLPKPVREIVHWFFESFYDPALYKGKGYRISLNGQQILFDRSIYLEKYAKANKDIVVCPMCDGDLGSPKVDHFFPKAQYPYLSCHPGNLVPICDDCNGTSGKFQNLPISSDAINQTLDWFHPYFRNANGTYFIGFEHPPEGLTPVLKNEDAQVNTRLENFSKLVNLRSRWRNALSRKVRATQRKIEKETRTRNANLSEQELIEKIQQWGDNQECEIGLEPFAILENAYLESVVRHEPFTFDELMTYANHELDVVTAS